MLRIVTLAEFTRWKNFEEEWMHRDKPEDIHVYTEEELAPRYAVLRDEVTKKFNIIGEV